MKVGPVSSAGVPPVVFLDRNLRVLFASGEARRRCGQWGRDGHGFAAGSRQPLRLPPEVLRACMRLNASLAESGGSQGGGCVVHSPLTGLSAIIEVCTPGEGEPALAGFLVHLVRGPHAGMSERPPRVSAEGIGALSPSEERVARLVATGKSNRAVARELCKSERTVECQLSAIYRKLGVTNRVQLCRKLMADAEHPPGAGRAAR